MFMHGYVVKMSSPVKRLKQKLLHKSLKLCDPVRLGHLFTIEWLPLEAVVTLKCSNVMNNISSSLIGPFSFPTV